MPIIAAIGTCAYSINQQRELTVKSSIARVHINGIEVGSLPADTYNALVKSVRRDRRLYLAWSIAAAKACLRPLGSFYCSLPSVVVGICLLAAVVWPEAFTAFVTDLRAADPTAITEGLRRVLWLFCITFTVTFPMLALLKPGLIRFESPFERALSRKIRRLLEVPTEGALMVEIIEQADKAE